MASLKALGRTGSQSHGSAASDAKLLRDLESDNAKPGCSIARYETLEKTALKEALSRKWQRREEDAASSWIKADWYEGATAERS